MLTTAAYSTNRVPTRMQSNTPVVAGDLVEFSGHVKHNTGVESSEAWILGLFALFHLHEMFSKARAARRVVRRAGKEDNKGDLLRT